MGRVCEVGCVLAVMLKQAVAVKVGDEAFLVVPADSSTFDPCFCPFFEGRTIW